MTREEFITFVTQYCNDTSFLSFTKRDHPAYIELMKAPPEAITWALEKLKDTIGHDRGVSYDPSNSPWLLMDVLNALTKGQCVKYFPHKYAGQLDRLRTHHLAWGVSQGLIKL